MVWLALKTFFHERVRLATTLVGITFSTVLTLAQVSMYLGSMGNSSTITRHTDADIRVTSKNLDMKVFEVKVSLKDKTPLKPGMSVDVRIMPALKKSSHGAASAEGPGK